MPKQVGLCHNLHIVAKVVLCSLIHLKPIIGKLHLWPDSGDATLYSVGVCPLPEYGSIDTIDRLFNSNKSLEIKSPNELLYTLPNTALRSIYPLWRGGENIGLRFAR